MILVVALVVRFVGVAIARTIGVRSIALAWKTGGLRAVAGFLIRRFLFLVAARFTISAVWGFIVSTREFIFNFDWTQPDKSLDRQIAARWGALAGQLGGTLGGLVGWITCGALPGATIMAFNPSLGTYILKEVGEEALEEFVANFAALFNSITRNVTQSLFIEIFKNARRQILGNPNHPLALLIKAYKGEKFYNDMVKAYREQRSLNWTFANDFENWIESFPNTFWRNFAEEFFEEAWDACVEAGFVVSYSIESWMALNKLNQQNQLGKDRVVEITPDRESDEKIVLAGPEKVLMPTIAQAVTQHQLLQNRDIGQFVGESVDENARRADPTLRLKIILYQNQAPPFESTRAGQRVTRVTVTIPDVRRSKLDFSDIKLACGGRNGYLWGRFKANGKLSNGHYLTVYGASKAEAEDRLRLFAALSEAELRTINVTEELKEGDRLVNPGLYKETTRIYPAYCFIINRELILAGDRGQPVGRARYKDKRFRLELWPEQKPYDWEEIVQEALRKSS